MAINGMPEQSIKPLSTRDISFDPEIIYEYGQGRIKCKGIYLRQGSIYFIR